jgi:hypothetical protein
MGLGYAVTRDIASFLRFQTKDDAGNPNPLAQSPTNVGITKVYESGVSSTGLYSRDFFYMGFNEDESHRKVFDAALIIIPGTHRLFANVSSLTRTFTHARTSGTITPPTRTRR